MTNPLDLDAILDRTERAYAAARSLVDTSGRAGVQLPGAIREHFNYDVPALVGALRHRGAQLNLVGIAVNLPSDQATTDTAPYSTKSQASAPILYGQGKSQCPAEDSTGLGCAGPVGHPDGSDHANINGTWPEGGNGRD